MDERCKGCIAMSVCSNEVSFGENACLEVGLKLAVVAKETVEKTVGTPVKDAFSGIEKKSQDGTSWLVFTYTEEDKDPWKWPKVLESNGKYYIWMSWNSDNHSVNYRECNETRIAFKSKRKLA